jgi:asparagine synthase (glutamine-hydrolysing)
VLTPFGFSLSAAPSGATVEVFGRRCPLVSSFEHGGHLAVVLGRLHYRQDALAWLDIAPEEATNDAALALASYRSGGIDGLARLEGEFSAAVWDASSRCLVGRRDPLGAYPLFWARTPHCTMLATCLDPLLRLLPTKALDADYLAGFLLSGRSEPASEACAYRGVHRVLADTIVTLGTDSDRVTRRVYWNWLDHIVDPATDRIDEVGRQYRDLLAAAVRERMDGLTASQLSGGMDSTSVCLLALELVRSGGATPPLHAVSLVYDRLPQLAKERPYIRAVLEGGADLISHCIGADDLLDFDCFRDAPLHDEPFHGLAAVTTERALVETAAALGASTVLTGRGGDDLLVSEPSHIADLIRAGRLVSGWKEARRFALVRGSNAGRVFRRHGLRQVVPRHAGRLRTQSDLRRLDDRLVPPWISPAFARRHDLHARARDGSRGSRPPGLPTPLALGLRQLEHRVGDPFRWALAAPLGLSLSHPFLDPRVVGLALGALTRLAPSPEPAKPLLAEAMRGVLPEAIRTRRSKRSFNEVYYLGLRHNLPRLEALVGEAPLEILGINGAALVRYTEDAAMGVADPRQSFGVDTALALLKWMSMQPDFRSSEQVEPARAWS